MVTEQLTLMLNQQERYINPYTDFGFKKLFGTEMNKELLVSFLNALLSKSQPKKVISGGPMMGLAVSTLDVPITKTTNAITVLLEDEVEQAELKLTTCLHCGRCTTVCPNGLMPQMMADAIVAGDMERYEKKLYGLDCIFCGSCTYICPAKRPLTQNFKQTKAEILAKKRAAQAAQGGGK